MVLVAAGSGATEHQDQGLVRTFLDQGKNPRNMNYSVEMFLGSLEGDLS